MFKKLILLGVVVLIAVVYFLAMNIDTNKELGPGDYAEYEFNVMPVNISGTYRWQVLSVDNSRASVLEQTNTVQGLQNYTSYLDLRTDEITRYRTTANGTLKEALCFILTDVSRAASCRYYAPLNVSGEQIFSFNNVQRAAWKIEVDDPAYSNSYILFDKKTGIMLYSITDLGGVASEYSLIGTNIF